jgi:hypothetical protein
MKLGSVFVYSPPNLRDQRQCETFAVVRALQPGWPSCYMDWLPAGPLALRPQGERRLPLRLATRFPSALD